MQNAIYDMTKGGIYESSKRISDICNVARIFVCRREYEIRDEI